MIRGFPNARGLCEILRKTCVCLLEGKKDSFLTKGENVSKGMYKNI